MNKSIVKLSNYVLFVLQNQTFINLFELEVLTEPKNR